MGSWSVELARVDFGETDNHGVWRAGYEGPGEEGVQCSQVEAAR